MRLEQSRLKIERANKHITDLDERISNLPSSNTTTVEINPNAGNEVIKHDFGDKSVITDLALMAGDAIHNLKCALDYAWLETIQKVAPFAVSKFAKFPVYPTRDALEAALRDKKIDIFRNDLFRLVLDEIKPYDGGNYAIWPVHRLDIRDKHRLLIPVIQYSSVDGIETENKVTGEISKDGFTWLTDQNPPLYIPMPQDLHVKNKGQISINVMFEYGVVGQEFRVEDSFSFFSRFILEIVEIFERFLEVT